MLVSDRVIRWSGQGGAVERFANVSSRDWENIFARWLQVRPARCSAKNREDAPQYHAFVIPYWCALRYAIAFVHRKGRIVWKSSDLDRLTGSTYRHRCQKCFSLRDHTTVEIHEKEFFRKKTKLIVLKKNWIATSGTEICEKKCRLIQYNKLGCWQAFGPNSYLVFEEHFHCYVQPSIEYYLCSGIMLLRDRKMRLLDSSLFFVTKTHSSLWSWEGAETSFCDCSKWLRLCSRWWDHERRTKKMFEVIWHWYT